MINAVVIVCMYVCMYYSLESIVVTFIKIIKDDRIYSINQLIVKIKFIYIFLF